MSQLRKTDVAYLAGFFDGEGAVMLSFNNSGGLKIGVACSQNTEDVLLLFKQGCGGHVYQHQPKGRQSLIFQWRANGADAIAFLELVRPWLLVKAKSCEEALNAWQAKNNNEPYEHIVQQHRERVHAERAAR